MLDPAVLCERRSWAITTSERLETYHGIFLNEAINKQQFLHFNGRPLPEQPGLPDLL